MRVLVINCGSSSLKYAVYDTLSREALARGLVERIGNAAEHGRIWVKSDEQAKNMGINDKSPFFAR